MTDTPPSAEKDPRRRHRLNWRGFLRRAWGPQTFQAHDILPTFLARLTVVLAFACFIVLLMLLVVMF